MLVATTIAALLDTAVAALLDTAVAALLWDTTIATLLDGSVATLLLDSTVAACGSTVASLSSVASALIASLLVATTAVTRCAVACNTSARNKSCGTVSSLNLRGNCGRGRSSRVGIHTCGVSGSSWSSLLKDRGRCGSCLTLLSAIGVVPCDGEPVFSELVDVIAELNILFLFSDDRLNHGDCLVVQVGNAESVLGLGIGDLLLLGVVGCLKGLLALLCEVFELLLVVLFHLFKLLSELLLKFFNLNVKLVLGNLDSRCVCLADYLHNGVDVVLVLCLFLGRL